MKNIITLIFLLHLSFLAFSQEHKPVFFMEGNLLRYPKVVDWSEKNTLNYLNGVKFGRRLSPQTALLFSVMGLNYVHKQQSDGLNSEISKKGLEFSLGYEFQIFRVKKVALFGEAGFFTEIARNQYDATFPQNFIFKYDAISRQVGGYPSLKFCIDLAAKWQLLIASRYKVGYFFRSKAVEVASSHPLFDFGFNDRYWNFQFEPINNVGIRLYLGK